VQFTAISARLGWAYQNPKLTQDYLLALLRANRYVYETAPEHPK
jgi:ABC-type nitrate/sulfonate/bicarbonate transport system substrate-binding protein